MLLIAAPAHARTPALARNGGWPTGIYGNLRYVPEADDLVGQEVRFLMREGRPWVEFVDCEGECSAVYESPLERAGDSVVFRYVERPEGQDSAAGGTSPRTYRVTLTPQGSGFGAHVAVEGQPDVIDAEQAREEARPLRSLKKAFGLDLARARHSGRSG